MNFPADQHAALLPTQPDRRADPRFSVQVQLELHEDGSDVPIRAETADLSRGGFYVQWDQTISPGTYVQGRLWLADAPMDFRGRVVTKHPQFGNGIMFLTFDGNGEQLLRRYLDAIVS